MTAAARPETLERPAHSGLQCLVAIASHHGIGTTTDRLLHDNALSEEIDVPTLVRIAKKIGLKARAQKMSVESLFRLGSVFPMVGAKRDGTFLVIVGTARNDAESVVGILDPANPAAGVHPVPEQAFAEMWAGEVVLLKRTYAISDENQPFGLRWFLPQILLEKRIFRDIAVAALALQAIGLLVPVYFQLVVDKVLTHHSISTLTVLTVGIVCALLFEGVFNFLRQYLLLFATNKIDIRLATRTFAHLMNLPLSYFEQTPTGVAVRHMQQVEKIRQFLTGKLFLTALDAVALFVLLPILFLYSAKLTLIVLLFTAIIGGVVASLIVPFRRRLQDLYNAEAKRQAMLVEAVTGMRTVKSLAVEPMQRRKWDDRAAEAVSRHFRVGKISAVAQSSMSTLEKLMTILVIAVGAFDVFAGTLSVGALIAFQMLAGRVVQPLIQIVGLVHEYQETALSVRMLAHIMNHPPERPEGRTGVRMPIRGKIEFQNVTFRYAPMAPPALDRFSITINPGAVIGVVGKSGSGKTTLTRLLQGLFSQQEGIIRLDGIDLREIDLPHLRRSIGVVLQDNFLFHGTVRENVSLTRPDASLEDVVIAANMAGAAEFIERLPQGYDTVLEENGSNLSGGQKQRLAIARALLTQPRILILDEATSALDPDSEAIFMNNLARIAQGRTVVIVSHRLSTLVNCNAIVVLESGRISDVGKHSELIDRCNLYKHLWTQQNRNM